MRAKIDDAPAHTNPGFAEIVGKTPIGWAQSPMPRPISSFMISVVPP